MTDKNIIKKEELLEIASYIESTSTYSTRALLDFFSDPHRILYSHFAFRYFVFGETRTPDEVKSVPEGTIFAKLRKYGSSKHYKGIINVKGEVTICTMFDSIESFCGKLVKVKRNNKYGIFNLDGGMICPIEYDEIYECSEGLFGVRSNNKIGFMDTSGNLTIPFNFDYNNPGHDGYIIPCTPFFSKGLACVYKEIQKGNGRFGYINHSGKIIFPFDFDMDIAFTEDVIKNFHTEELGNDYRRDTYKLWADGSIELEESEYVDNFNYTEYELSLGSYRDNAYDNSLDAYEGDESNRWNTD